MARSSDWVAASSKGRKQSPASLTKPAPPKADIAGSAAGAPEVDEDDEVEVELLDDDDDAFFLPLPLDAKTMIVRVGLWLERSANVNVMVA